MRDRDTRELHVRQRGQRGQLDVHEHRSDALLQLVTKSGDHAQRVPGELSRSGALGLGHELRRIGFRQLLAEIALDEIAECLVGEARAQQPSGQDRVVGDARDPEPRPAERLELRLGVAQHLRRVGGEPGGQRRRDLIGPGGLHGLRALALDDARQADALGRTAEDRHGHARLGLRAAGPGRELGSAHLPRLRRGLCCGLGLLLGDLSGGLEHPRQQGAELQAREDVANGLGIQGLPDELLGPNRQLDVAEKTVEPAIAADVLHVGHEIAAHNALDRVGALEQRVEGSELGEPLHRGLLADLRHAGQVVARLTHQGGDVGVHLGCETVLLDDRGRVVALELGDALHRRIEQRDVVVDELDRVAVARAQQHPEAGLDALRGQRGEDVIGLEIGLGQHRHPHGLEALLEEGDLSPELRRRLGPIRLVLGVLAGAE